MLIIGWLSPDGKLYECDYQDHIIQAEKLCEEYNYTDINEIKDDVLLSHNWVHLTMTTYITHSWMILWNYDLHLTIEQKQFLKPYIEENVYWIDDLCLDRIKHEYGDELYIER